MGNNARSSRPGYPVPPVAPFPKSSLSQRPRTRISGRWGGGSVPSPQDSPDGAWATSSATEEQRLPHLPKTLLGGTPLCSQHPARRENPPFTPTTEEGWRNGHRSIYQPVSRRRKVERRVGTGGRPGPVRLGSVPWLECERWSRAGVLGAGLRWVSCCALAPASARWTAPAPPPYKGERAGSRGLAPPH